MDHKSTNFDKFVDLPPIEEREGKLHGFEFKWSDAAKRKDPKDWLKTYPNADLSIIDRENYLDFIL